MNQDKKMNILVETFFNSESGPVLSLNIAQGLQENNACVCAIISEQIENLEDWKASFSSEYLYIWKPYKNRYVENIFNGIKIKLKFLDKRFDYALYPNPVKRNLVVEKFFRVKENIMILHDVIPHSGTKENFNNYVKNIVEQSDNIMVLSKQFIPIVEKEYHKSKNNIFYMKHGLMKYPEYNGDFSNDELQGKLNFLYFGRIEKYKGLHVLAEAFGSLQKQYPDAYLTVAGSGEFAEYEEEYAALKNVSVMNKYITDEEIAFLFSRPNTVVVLPYLDATQSGVIGMAYNYETPILVTDTGGIREQLFDGEVGVYAAPGDAEDLKEKMARFLEEPDLFAEQKALMQESKEKMSWDYITKEFLEQLEEHRA